METIHDHRAAAARLLTALPAAFTRLRAHKAAEAVAKALWASGLMRPGPLTSSGAFIAARDAFASLAHHLDATTAGNGPGRLLLLLTSEREHFTPFPPPTGPEARVRDAAGALLTFLEWHCDEPLDVLDVGIRFHAELCAREAKRSAPSQPSSPVVITPGTGVGGPLVHLTVLPWTKGVLAVCGAALTTSAAAESSAQCDGCFGRVPVEPRPVLTAAEHDAWTDYLNGTADG